MEYLQAYFGLKLFSAYFWMVASVINMFVFMLLYYKVKNYGHLFTGIMWFSCAMWGMTVSAVNVPWIKVFNEVILPINASIFGTIAGFIKLKQAINEKHI